MKKSEILKELKEIQEQMSECIVGAWNRNLDSTSEAILLEDFEGGCDDEPDDIEYNGWNERLEKLVEALEKGEPTKMEVMVKNFYEYISMDDDTTSADIEEEIKKLENHGEEHDTLDHVLSDRFTPVEPFEYSFTVGSFLEQIDTKGYE